MQRVVELLEALRRLGQRLGPYLMLEILLPGGSLFALALFLYQRRKARIGSATPSAIAALAPLWAALAWIWAALAPHGIFMAQPCYVRSSRALRSAVDPSE